MISDYLKLLIDECGVSKIFKVAVVTITIGCIGAIVSYSIIPNNPVNPDTINNEKENIYEN